MQSSSLIAGIILLLSGIFGLRALYVNDKAIDNKWLSLSGWFLIVVVLVTAAYHFINHFVLRGYLEPGSPVNTISRVFYISIVDYIIAFSMIIFSMYLYSLSRDCMKAEYLPRTLRIWILKRWHKFRYK